jgi:hypothetical protein
MALAIISSAMQNDEGAAISKTGEQRTGYRVHCALPLRVSGTDGKGEPFSVAARTEIVTRDGGLIVSSVSLAPGAQVTLHNGDKQAPARIVAVLRVMDAETAYGVAFVAPITPGFWGIRLSDTRAMPAVGRTVLECSLCHTREAVELGEIEIVVLEKVSVLGRFCDLCLCDTLWEPPRNLGDSMLVTGSAAYSMPTRATEIRQRTRDDRNHRRLSFKRSQACIKMPGMPDDIVYVGDFSRGGVRFMSTVDYQRGARVEIAFPYTDGGANIYVPAIVLRVILRARSGSPGDYACP